jgi:hypothetical protein
VPPRKPSEVKRPARKVGVAKIAAETPTKKTHPRRPTVSQIVKRNQEIVSDREIDCMTWGEIARKHGVTEKSARDGYVMYVAEIAPLVEYEQGFEKAREFVRVLEGMRARFVRIAVGAKQPGQRIAALREARETLAKEIELRQAIGLLPRDLRELSQVIERGWVAQQAIDLLRKYDAPEEAFTEFHEIMVAASSS